MLTAKMAAHAAWMACPSGNRTEKELLRIALAAACRADSDARRQVRDAAEAAEAAEDAAIAAAQRAATARLYAAEAAEFRRLGYTTARESSRFARLGQPEWGQ